MENRGVLLAGEHTGVEHLIEGATWADWDQRGRFVFASNGKLLVSEGKEFDPKVIADLNPLEPTQVEAPDWAKRW